MAKNVNDHSVAHVTKASGNIFTDLGFSEASATALLAEADAEIAQRQALRETLAGALISWIDHEKLRQEDAAAILKISRPRVSDIYRKKVEKFSVDTLIALAGRAGMKVQLKVA
ncbi:helix-turn-helix domain-containing protein [Xanthomonas campestris pv. uppalii]|uniref:helix-turn-helix domain-containing protein n=1 Tax=Xanthomonas TaxID=338 RepID=UPI001C46AEE0|nr:XRE family transcriptional regulator [Xanthomonas euvesicatoria]MBV6785182.1 helix-turn-helix domain-containing protein [Xanthomonas campestris pv. uppalii]